MTLEQLQREKVEAQRAATLAVRHLLTQTNKPALLLRTWTRETFTPVSFPNESVIEAVALQNGCRLATVVRPVLGNFDHYLFLTKVDDLSDDQLLSCGGPEARSGWGGPI